ncbi:MAG: hypothetical protein KC912_14140 [Proteobacteria bacterium]|nr:hypothetical protein [Pseudomonadota bacterium]
MWRMWLGLMLGALAGGLGGAGGALAVLSSASSTPEGLQAAVSMAGLTQLVLLACGSGLGALVGRTLHRRHQERMDAERVAADAHAVTRIVGRGVRDYHELKRRLPEMDETRLIRGLEDAVLRGDVREGVDLETGAYIYVLEKSARPISIHDREEAAHRSKDMHPQPISQQYRSRRVLPTATHSAARHLR